MVGYTDPYVALLECVRPIRSSTIESVRSSYGKY